MNKLLVAKQTSFSHIIVHKDYNQGFFSGGTRQNGVPESI
jgi:hypothetical protein